MKVNMKYLAFRIDTTAIKSHEVVHGYFVRGQLIAEMLFETEALYRHLVPGKIWNEYEMAAAYIRKTIGQEEENEED